MNTSLIVAIDKNNGISKDGLIPWHIKEDVNFFIDVTKRQYVTGLKNVLIMGKHTWISCRNQLKDRVIIVVSSTMTLENYENTSIVDTVDKAMQQANQMFDDKQIGHIFICGGSKIYEASSKYCNTIYLTSIDRDYECDNKIKLNINHYHTFRKHTFPLIDLNNNHKVNVTFEKLYLQLPDHWQDCEERQYLNLLADVLTTGDFRQTRNSMTWSKFGKTLEFDLSKGFPLITTKKMFVRGIFEELIFFLKGQTDSKILEEKGVNIWKDNSTREFLDSVGLNYPVGTIGPMYGYNWNHFGFPYQGSDYDYTDKGFSQINYCLNLLKNDPHSRRIIMTTYNPSVAHQGVLWPCHSLMLQFFVEKDYKLSLACFNRSQDLGIGIQFNFSSTALLIHFFCIVINSDESYHGPKYTPGRLIMNLGDVHIYESHKSSVVRQILRDPYKFPEIKINPNNKLTEFKFEDCEWLNYQCYPNIVAKMVA